MSKVDMVLVSSDDWEVIYAGGEKLIEDHSIQVYDILKLLYEKVIGDIVILDFDTEEAEKWLETSGYTYPKLLSDIPKELTKYGWRKNEPTS